MGRGENNKHDLHKRGASLAGNCLLRITQVNMCLTFYARSPTRSSASLATGRDRPHLNTWIPSYLVRKYTTTLQYTITPSVMSSQPRVYKCFYSHLPSYLLSKTRVSFL